MPVSKRHRKKRSQPVSTQPIRTWTETASVICGRCREPYTIYTQGMTRYRDGHLKSIVSREYCAHPHPPEPLWTIIGARWARGGG